MKTYFQLVFEPKEISARSSELNKTPEKKEPFPQQNFSGISYDSNLAALRGEFNDEVFLSESKANSKLLADELSWRKEQQFGSIPIDNTNKERLELTCFSGIVGSDVTIDEGRVSVGEFFRRGCGNIGQLSFTSFSDRPSMGIDVQSPKRQGKLRPLIDETMKTEGKIIVK